MLCINVLCASKANDCFIFLFWIHETKRGWESPTFWGEEFLRGFVGLYIKDGACSWGSVSTTPATPGLLCNPSAWCPKPHPGVILAFWPAEPLKSHVLVCLKAEVVPCPPCTLSYRWSDFVWACFGELVPEELEHESAYSLWLSWSAWLGQITQRLKSWHPQSSHWRSESHPGGNGRQLCSSDALFYIPILEEKKKIHVDAFLGTSGTWPVQTHC